MLGTWTGGFPAQGLLRVQSSHMITPRLKISHFSVNGSLRISSGAIHSGVPADELSLIAEFNITRESPKSHNLTVQCLLTRQFALFRSRWTIFKRCIHIRPLAQTNNQMKIYITRRNTSGTTKALKTQTHARDKQVSSAYLQMSRSIFSRLRQLILLFWPLVWIK